MLISLGVFGTLTVDEVTGYGETAIAEAARPTLGEAGFVMMAIAALLATASSVNATLYASGGLTAMLADDRPVPAVLRARLAARLSRRAGDHQRARARRRQPRRPVGDRVGRQRLLAVIFLLVGIAGYRRRADTNARAEIVLAAIAVTAIVLVFFAVDTLRNAPETFTAIVAIALLSVALDFVWKRSRAAHAQQGTAPTGGAEPTPPSAG